jgi:hypothetical protein
MECLLTTNSFPRDAFQRRERANEDYAIKQREKEKLLELKKKLADQQVHLKKLSDSMLVSIYSILSLSSQRLFT